MNVKPVVLLMNDIHVSKDDIIGFMINWSEAIKICNKNNIKEIVIGGDLWLSRSSQTLSTLMAVRHVLNEAILNNINVTIAEGNHDKVDQESRVGYGHVFKNEADGIYVIGDYSTMPIDCEEDSKASVFLHTMCYFPENGSFQGLLKELIDNELRKDCYNILYIHEGISGALATANDKELPTHIFKDFDKVLVGHYHDRCKIPGTNIEYIGASRQHNFGEDEEKGYTILYSDGSHKFIKNTVNIRYITLDVVIKQVNEKLLEKIRDLRANDRYKVRVRIQCKNKEISSVNKQELVEAGANKVEFITENIAKTEIASKSLDKKFDKSGIKKEYCDFCADKEVNNIEMGLSYLDKIN